jgi:V/A-type H+-transporting ATPase subunit I
MLLPEKMTKVLIVGPNDRLEDAISVLYSSESVHPIDFSPGEDGINIGAPFPSASAASEKLLKLRAVKKNLDVQEKELPEKLPVSDIEAEAGEAIISLETEIASASATRSNLQSRIHELELQKKQLEPILTVPLDLELYRGYRTLAVYAGFIRTDPEGVITEAVQQYEIFKSEDGKFIIVFVPKSEAEETQRILSQHGFTEFSIPEGKGTPQEAAKKIDEELAVLAKSEKDAADKVGLLRDEHEAFVLAAEEQMSITVEKAEFPLRTGSTGHAFIVDAWIPSKSVKELEQALKKKLGDDIYIEATGSAARKEVHEEGAEVAFGVEAHEKEMVPVMTSPPRPSGLFSFLTELISLPRYNEIDPTVIVSITFPIFFGLMVGDVGYSIPFIILGYVGLKRVKSPEWRTIATMLLFGGIWATIFGLFMFGEAFGMHFALRPGELTWSSLLGVNIPNSINMGAFSIPLGIYSKLHDVKILLYITVWIGVAHLFIGFGIGFYNQIVRHGLKHAIMSKFSWILILIGVALLLLVMVDALILNLPLALTDPRLILGLVTLISGIVMAYIGEGGGAILELPGLMSNIISYTRLAAIGMSKAGLALAFNTIAFANVMGFNEAAGRFSGNVDAVIIVAGLAIFIMGHLTIFILAILSAGLHAIRLHYVELFTKFFEGGGLKFNPLRTIRKYTKLGKTGE